MLPLSAPKLHVPALPRISSRTHGVLDYAAVIWLAITPRLFAFGDASTAVSLTASLVILLMSVTTGYPLGLLKMIPFGGHVVADYVISLVLILSPTFFAFSPQDPGGPLLLWAGIVLLAGTLVTQVRPTSARRGRALLPV